jgi:hypothetical protein
MVRVLRVLLLAALLILLGVGAVWVGKHAPVPSNRASARELARVRKLERAHRALVRRLRARARRAEALERARTRWARRANGICRRAVGVERTALRRIGQARSAGEFFDVLSTTQGESRAVLSELEALPPPPGRAASFQRMVRAYEAGSSLGDEAVAALRRGDAAGALRIVQRALRVGEHGDEVARNLGAYVCADGIFADSS